MKLSRTYRILKNLGFNLSEEQYGEITLWRATKRVIKGTLNACILKYCMYSVILAPLNYRKIRPILWRWMGVKVGKNVFIGYDVWMDYNNAHLIELQQGAHITNRCILLCHKRNLDNYYVGDDSTKLPYKIQKIVVGKNVMVGMGTTIMPGVTIGEGSIIAANSLVTKNIPAWTIAAGNPAKVIKEIQRRK